MNGPDIDSLVHFVKPIYTNKIVAGIMVLLDMACSKQEFWKYRLKDDHYLVTSGAIKSESMAAFGLRNNPRPYWVDPALVEAITNFINKKPEKVLKLDYSNCEGDLCPSESNAK